jgi:hypothetical protein
MPWCGFKSGFFVPKERPFRLSYSIKAKEDDMEKKTPHEKAYEKREYWIGMTTH